MRLKPKQGDIFIAFVPEYNTSHKRKKKKEKNKIKRRDIPTGVALVRTNLLKVIVESSRLHTTVAL